MNEQTNRRMVVEEERTIEVQTPLVPEELHVLRSGTGPSRFLIWHGFDSVNRFFQWKYIQKYGEVIRVGLPGHGPVTQKSWSHYRRWTQEHLIEVGVSVCKRYFSKTPLTLVGHSTGAHIVLGAAMRLPEMIGALVLVNPLLWSPVNGFIRFLAKSRLWRLIGTSALAPGIRRKRRSIGSFLEGIRPIIGDRDSFYGNPNTPSYTATGHEDYKRSSIAALVNVARICATFDLRPAIGSISGERPPLMCDAPIIAPEHPATADAMTLIAELDAYLEPLYPRESPAGRGGIKLFGTEYGELKRMYVRPQFRGAGLAKLLIEHLADHARRHGVGMLRLETGIHQRAAVGLYEQMGFQRIPPFGQYWDDPVSRCYEKRIL